MLLRGIERNNSQGCLLYIYRPLTTCMYRLHVCKCTQMYMHTQSSLSSNAPMKDCYDVIPVVHQ